MIYTKTINGRQIFSDCRTVQTNDGVWISNPSQQQILDAGWSIYEPPEPEPATPITEPDDTEIMQAVKRMLASSVAELSDEDALTVAALYPTWTSKIGDIVNVGERYWYDGRLWKVIQSHTAQDDWTPDVSVSLFTEVTIDEWPEWRQPTGSTDAYMIGDKVTFEGVHYISLIDNNVWSPSALPSGWEARS